MLLVERHYLRTYGGGFTENFYGLKRERVLAVKGGDIPRAQQGTPSIVREAVQLRGPDVWKNLAVMVGLPYLKRKLDESYDIHAPQATILGPNFDRDALPPNATVRQRLLHHYKWFLRHIYPSVNAAYYFSLLAFNLAYLFDGSKYQSPFLWLIGTRVRRLGEADHRALALANQHHITPSRPGARPGQGSSMFNPATMASAVGPRIFSSLHILLPTSIFALKFLEWWHASDFARQLSRKAAEGLELPPPVISGLPPPQAVDPKPSSAPPPPSSVSLANAPTSTPNEPSTDDAVETTRSPLLSATSYLPILTVPLPAPSSSGLCPICLSPVQTPTACQTGFVFCYTCIHKWVEGRHERQTGFMEGGGGEAGGGEAGRGEAGRGEAGRGEAGWGREEGSRTGRWDSGAGRCAVTGRRVLGGTEGLRRVMV